MLNINFISFFLFQVDEKNKEKSVQWLIIEKLKGVGLGGGAEDRNEKWTSR